MLVKMADLVSQFGMKVTIPSSILIRDIDNINVNQFFFWGGVPLPYDHPALPHRFPHLGPFPWFVPVVWTLLKVSHVSIPKFTQPRCYQYILSFKQCILHIPLYGP